MAIIPATSPSPVLPPSDPRSGQIQDMQLILAGKGRMTHVDNVKRALPKYGTAIQSTIMLKIWETYMMK